MSLLSQFSNVLEKVFCRRIVDLIDLLRKILSDDQCSFRNNHSTSHVLFNITEETNAIDNKKYAIVLFIDLSKAFNTMNHDVLINKLEQYGIIGVALQSVNSHLRNKTMCENGKSSVQMSGHCLWFTSRLSSGSKII